MPELPEVETMRRGILPAIHHRIIDLVQPASRYRPISIRPSFEELRERLIGRVITDVQRLGKRVVVEVDDDQYVILQPKMAGLIFYR